MENLTGQTIDRYEIVELIGEGGMATVYRARQRRLQRDVAVKVMLPELAADRTFRERFELEAQASANLRHPNILTVHDYGETEGGLLYLVVEYVQAGTLRERLEPSPPVGGTKGGRLPLEEAVEIIAQVAEALDYAHRQGMVHRDVKPNNILLTQDGRPLLADFGLVKPVASDRQLTASGMMLGTPDYVAPEQARALTIDGRADIYALGVMLFETLTGRHPFTGETPVSIIIKHATEPLPQPSTIRSGVPPALDAIVAKATAKSPDERYQRGGEMARALRAVLIPGKTPEVGTERAPSSIGAEHRPQRPEPASSAPAPVADVTPAPVSGPWQQQVKVWVALAAVLAVALLVIALFILPALSPQDQDDTQAGLPGSAPTAAPGQTMILIAQFKAQQDSERYDVSQRIYDKLSEDLQLIGEEKVAVHQVPDVIESSEAAVALGRQYGATTVIWGYYDDIGISPNIEAIGGPDEKPLSVGTERFNLGLGEAADYKLYIAKILPEELSFLTALSLVQTFLFQGRLNETMTYMSVAAAKRPADLQFRRGGEMVHYLQGMMAFFEGDLEGAIERMDQAIAVDPDKGLFYTMRGLARVQKGELELALVDLERAIALDPGDVLAYNVKGAAEGIMGDMQAMLRTFEQLTALNPDDWVGHYIQGWVRFEMGDLDRAAVSFDRVEEIGRVGRAEPAELLAPVSRGLVYEKMGQGERAAGDYARAVTSGAPPTASLMIVGMVAGPEVPVPYPYLIECTTYQARGEIEEALAACNRALETSANHFDARWKRGQLYAAQEEWELAIADYTAAIQVDPRWPWVYYLRAQALIEAGRDDEAQADLARALELEPVEVLRWEIEALRP